MSKYCINGKWFHFAKCPTCDTEHAFEMHIYNALQERKEEMRCYCPNGHHWYYLKGESEKAKLRRERDQLKQRLAQKDDEIVRQRELKEHAERSAAAYKGQTTKLKNRAQAGVCPCCTRHFTNLERHMKSKHPEVGTQEPLKVIDGGKAA